ncbi:MAG TPA: MraY family glycosyltransferase, partial [Patescibacteria group bacterium]|nr:MraY family glycosyltransferase [Patescibacteria group bacterium]
ISIFDYPVVSAFLIAFLATAVITPLFIIINKKLGLLDDPKKHIHPAIIHDKPIPRGGGIPIFLGILIAAFFFLPHTTTTFGLFAAGFLALAVGISDDILNAKGKEISPIIRFVINILTAVIVVASGISIKFITNPFGGEILHLNTIGFVVPLLQFPLFISDIISVIWLIWIMNMLNWSKGVDGQMPGIVAISAIVIGILSLRLLTGSENNIDAILSFIIAGGALGFLLFNFHPAKIFPGYGTTFLYLFLGVASILSSAKLATAVLVMGVPLVDFIFTIIRRILAKKSPFKGDKKHLHHILLQLGYNQRQVALFYWSISAILGIISLTLESKSKLFAIIMVGVITAGGLFFLHAVTKHTNDDTAS